MKFNNRLEVSETESTNHYLLCLHPSLPEDKFEEISDKIKRVKAPLLGLVGITYVGEVYVREEEKYTEIDVQIYAQRNGQSIDYTDSDFREPKNSRNPQKAIETAAFMILELVPGTKSESGKDPIIRDRAGNKFGEIQDHAALEKSERAQLT